MGMKRALVGVGIALVLIGALAYATTSLHGPVVVDARVRYGQEIIGAKNLDDADRRINRKAIRVEQIWSSAVVAVGIAVAASGFITRKQVVGSC